MTAFFFFQAEDGIRDRTDWSSDVCSSDLALSSPGRSIRAADIEFLHAAEPPPDDSGERLPSLREAERAHIVRILDACAWNKKEIEERRVGKECRVGWAHGSEEEKRGRVTD